MVVMMMAMVMEEKEVEENGLTSASLVDGVEADVVALL